MSADGSRRTRLRRARSRKARELPGSHAAPRGPSPPSSCSCSPRPGLWARRAWARRTGSSSGPRATRMGRSNWMGHLDDAVWAWAEFATTFWQREPDEGEPATRRTEVAFAYDEDALWIAGRMYTDDPDGIQAYRTRRDQNTGSERLLVSLDPYLNRRTAVSFGVNAAGSRTDWYHPEDNVTNRDYTWDPVWVGARAARLARMDGRDAHALFATALQRRRVGVGHEHQPLHARRPGEPPVGTRRSERARDGPRASATSPDSRACGGAAGSSFCPTWRATCALPRAAPWWAS